MLRTLGHETVSKITLVAAQRFKLKIKFAKKTRKKSPSTHPHTLTHTWDRF
jgi:hypothetical protein